jgi:cyclopropane-fatty-acyl-phospholipid synthase
VVLVVKSWWFFVRVALEYDLGLARSYMAGEFEVERTGPNSDGLTRLFMLFIRNRDQQGSG